MRSSYVIPFVFLCSVHMVSNCCQYNPPLVASLGRYPLVILLMMAHAARGVSAHALHAGGVCAVGMARHPGLTVLCAASLLLTCPQARVVIGQGRNGIVRICAGMAHWLNALFHSLFLGDVQQGIDNANATLALHTEQLHTIQTGVQAMQGQLDTVSTGIHAVQDQLGNVATDVTAVRQQVDESWHIMQDVRAEGHAHAQELGVVHIRCDAMNSILVNCQTQLSQLNDALGAHDASFDERVRQHVLTIQERIIANENVLNALRQQLAAMQQEISTQISGTNERLGHIEANQQHYYTQTMNVFNEGLQQVVQEICQAQQVQANGDRLRRGVMPITNISQLDKYLLARS